MNGQPLLSIVVLSCNKLALTTNCVDSIRATTDVAYELIVVDNGSTDGSAEYAQNVADIAVLNGENLGFAKGMNRGLEVARGALIAFVNNDTSFPEGWAPPLLSHFSGRDRVGIVVPAVTAAGNPVTVRSEPGSEVVTLPPFGELPSGVVYLMEARIMRELEGWNEIYTVATGEDLDLLFSAWTNDLDVILDTRVLIDHRSQGTLAERDDRHHLRQANLEQFLARWQSDDQVSRLASVPPDLYERNRRHARVAAMWLGRVIDSREQSRLWREQLESESARNTPAPPISRRRPLLQRLQRRWTKFLHD